MINYEKERNGIKKIVLIESYVLVIMVTCCGIVYGAESGRWLEAMEYLVIATGIIAIIMPLTYCCAEQRMHELIYFSRSRTKSSDQNFDKQTTSEDRINSYLVNSKLDLSM